MNNLQNFKAMEFRLYIIGGFVSIFPSSFVQSRYPLGTWSRSRQLNRQQSTEMIMMIR